MVKTTSLHNDNELSSFCTGKAPIYGVCPGVDSDGYIHSLPQVNVNASRKELLDYYDNTWTLTEVLFSGLKSVESYYKRPYHQLRHPMIFYYAHPAVLYINKFRVAGLINEEVNPRFEKLFETGVDEMRWDDLHEGSEDIWPSIEDVRQYRSIVYRIVCEIISTHPLFDESELPITMSKPSWALLMGFEHERIHFETSSVLIRELPIEMVRIPRAWPLFIIKQSKRENLKNPMIKLAKNEVNIGKSFDSLTYGWDNEYGNCIRLIRPFSSSSMLISNGVYYEFVVNNGYTLEEYWSSDGWSWRNYRNIKHPTFWIPIGPSGIHQYKLRTIFELIEMQWDYPVCVNYHEAKAYCAWRTERENSLIPYRLLTEGEHHSLRDENNIQWNQNLSYGNEIGVNEGLENSKGFFDVFGNVWEWCEDHFHPLKGGSPHRYYEDFSVPCYDGEHQLILGGSFASTGDQANQWARFHFRPHFFQHIGFRIVRNEDGNLDCDAQRIDKTITYETEEMLNNYLMMHWGENEQRFDPILASKITFPQVVDLPIACYELVRRFANGNDRALDLGCAVGRTTFELARDFKEVIGIDYSQTFIHSAKHIQQYGAIEYFRKDMGNKQTLIEAIVDPSIDRKRIRFSVGDACSLPIHFKHFDAVVFANVLCRLPDPIVALQRMQGIHGLVKPGGILVMTTPFSWLTNYTPQNKWLNGIEDVANILDQFHLIHQQELTFMIREHRRKYQYIITMASVWKRKSSIN